MSGSHIPDNDPKYEKRLIPLDSEERSQEPNGFTFRSLTDTYQPKEQYTNKLYQIATGNTNMLDEHIERLSRMIEARGHNVYLVKRRIDGNGVHDFCECYDSITHNVRRKKCLSCYGTRIKGGYDLYWNKNRQDGKIIIANPFTDSEIKLEDYGRDSVEINTYWTIPWVPLTNGSDTFSYDFVVQFNEDGSELGRYYIENVKPSRSVDNRITYQMFKARLADRPTVNMAYDGNGPNDIINRSGDIIYQIDINTLNKIEGGPDIRP